MVQVVSPPPSPWSVQRMRQVIHQTHHRQPLPAHRHRISCASNLDQRVRVVQSSVFETALIHQPGSVSQRARSIQPWSYLDWQNMIPMAVPVLGVVLLLCMPLCALGQLEPYEVEESTASQWNDVDPSTRNGTQETELYTAQALQTLDFKNVLRIELYTTLNREVTFEIQYCNGGGTWSAISRPGRFLFWWAEPFNWNRRSFPLLIRGPGFDWRRMYGGRKYEFYLLSNGALSLRVRSNSLRGLQIKNPWCQAYGLQLTHSQYHRQPTCPNHRENLISVGAGSIAQNLATNYRTLVQDYLSAVCSDIGPIFGSYNAGSRSARGDLFLSQPCIQIFTRQFNIVPQSWSLQMEPGCDASPYTPLATQEPFPSNARRCQGTATVICSVNFVVRGPTPATPPPRAPPPPIPQVPPPPPPPPAQNPDFADERGVCSCVDECQVFSGTPDACLVGGTKKSCRVDRGCSRGRLNNFRRYLCCV